MAILKLKKVLMFGSTKNKDEILNKLQDFGKSHIVFVEKGTVAGSKELSIVGDIKDAISFIDQCPKKFPDAKFTSSVDPLEIIERILELKSNLTKLKDEKILVNRQIELLEPWGDFQLEEIEEKINKKFYFYALSQKNTTYLKNSDYTYKIVNSDNTNNYVVILNEDTPVMPVEALEMPETTKSELLVRIEEIGVEFDRIYSMRVKLTRYTAFLNEYVNQVIDRASHISASLSSTELGEFFYIESFVPEPEIEDLTKIAEENKFAISITEPADDDLPPSLLKNSVPFDSGEDVVNIYATPGYGEWDPSAAVYMSFAIFYAMIVGDAGYGFIFLLITLFCRSKLKKSEGGNKFYRLMMTLSFTTITYGVITGGYFGVNLPADHFLKQLSLINPTAPESLLTMMTISILIGCIHIIIANLITAKNLFPKLSMIGSLGWVFAIIGGFLFWQFGILRNVEMVVKISYALIIGGISLVFLFSSESRSIVTRIIDGLLALTKISAAFGDILSYLRLFALGLSSSYMAITFNSLAGSANEIVGVGWLMAILILLIGHGINIALCVLGGVIHGLRLNFLEFYNWSLEGDGFLFKPFNRKGVNLWNR